MCIPQCSGQPWHGIGTVALLMFGSIRKLPSGKFQARYTLPQGTQTTAGVYLTRKDAETALLQLEAEAARGQLWDGRKGRTLFSEYMTHYMAFRATGGKVRPHTLELNQRALRLQLMPAFGHVRLDAITPEGVDAWFDSAPPSSTRRNAYGLLSKALRYAVKWGYIRSTPCLVEGAFADTSAPRPAYTIEDYRAVLTYVKEPYRRAFRVMFAGHLRLGELVALDWLDYDRRTGTVNITKQTTPKGETAETKTGQHRTVRLLSDGIAGLEELTPAVGTVPLLTGMNGKRLYRHTLWEVWHRGSLAAGLPGFRIHDLRHVGLSLVAESGASLKDVQTRGGHASVAAAMRYQHTTAERDAAVAERVDALLGWS